MRTRSFTITPVGEFSLAESALFGFGQRMRPASVGARIPQFDGVMRLAFCLDGYQDQVGVELLQDERVVHALVHGSGELDAIHRQVGRVLSLDQDARGFAQVGQRDLVIGRLQRAAVGLRPPLFFSPYEAAVRSVLSARRPGWQMSRVRADRSTGAATQPPLGAARSRLLLPAPGLSDQPERGTSNTPREHRATCPGSRSDAPNTWDAGHPQSLHDFGVTASHPMARRVERPELDS